MDNTVIEMEQAKDLFSTAIVCWSCQKALSVRALFCNHCGTIQPVRSLDHFTRLGLERRVDIDQAELERQYNCLLKTFTPDRFAIRSFRERGYAAQHTEALGAAYEVLRDPVQRGRYWLDLHDHDFDDAQAMIPAVQEMRHACEQALTAPAIDRVAQQASMAFEEGITRLMQSLRQQNWQSANLALLELDGMEVVLQTARHKRQNLE